MNTGDSKAYFVDNLTLRTWTLFVWPRLFLNRLRTGRKGTRCFVIDGSRFAMLVAWLSARLAGVAVERFAFSLAELRDEAGLQVQLRIEYQDLAEVQRKVIGEPIFQEFVNGLSQHDRLPAFVARKLATVSPTDRSTMSHALTLIQVCCWKTKQLHESRCPVVFLERRPWLKSIWRYGAEYGVTIIPVHTALNPRSALRRWLPREIIGLLRMLRHRRFRFSRSNSNRRNLDWSTANVTGNPEALTDVTRHVGQNSEALIAARYSGQLNLDHPERRSDLFFWQNASLRGSDVVVTFPSPRYPLDEQIWAELRQHGMAAVALHPGAATSPAMPVLTNRSGRKTMRKFRPSAALNGIESRWMNEQIEDYQTLREHWTKLCESYNIRVYVTWHKFDETHFAIADALQSLGGVTAIYQQAYEYLPSALATTAADIFFGFSQAGADIERRSNSIIQYHVTTGYLGDHRFALLRNSAQALRDRMQQSGAARILAYFDENTADDARWSTGHHFMQEDYAFLLEKVLAEPWFGLVIKPKTPSTLRRRLGPVAELLESAENTGRCYVFEAGAVQGRHMPAEAALSSDIAVHGQLYAGSAGIDAALAGVPTLLVDREGWSVSPLYRLGVGRVVFKDWEGLWEACRKHWSIPDGTPGFGDWTPMLDELDPFRDGRAAERMGTYIQWLIEGFQAGLDRDAVMADAAMRYCDIWGSDKITEVNGRTELHTLPRSSSRA